MYSVTKKGRKKQTRIGRENRSSFGNAKSRKLQMDLTSASGDAGPPTREAPLKYKAP